MSKDGLHNDTSLPSTAATTEEHSATSDILEKTEITATRLQNRDFLNKGPEQSSEPAPDTSPKSKLERHPWLQAHLRSLVVLGIAAVILLSMITISSIRATDKPSLNQVSSDIANLSEAPAYDPGDFGRDTTLTLDSVDYSEVIRDEDHCNATGAVIYAGDGIAAREKVSLLYDRHGHGKWSTAGNLIIQEVSWSASKGPDTDKVLTQARVFLQRADIAERKSAKTDEKSNQTNTSSTEQDSLYSLYRDADCTVFQEEFDSETNNATVVLAFSNKDSFSERKCKLTIKFHLSSQTGQWDIKSCTPDADARKTSYAPLVGTWTGSYQSQKNDGHGCYGANSSPLKITIGSTQTGDDGVTQLTGTFSGLVHHHGAVSKDTDSSEGDVRIENVSFTSTLETNTSGALVLKYTTPKSAEGTIELMLVFGGSKTPNAATATLTTHYENEQNFLVIPYTVRGEFADSYSLSKDGAD
ncbi:hypothetical protein [Atopobium sp. oral taxon 810]|uniref:hypothetical protein n=1 Tax=Atopobium sp. oral taxon 810 TaxID=712158 RepID=UPI0004062EE9|nr:hypothetical protein [Atopobium sp. oral taxon 810]